MSRASNPSPKKEVEAAQRKVKKLQRTPRAGALEWGSLQHIVAVLEALDAVYRSGSIPSDGFATGEPLDGLILTVLSQNTNDRNRDRAYERMRAAHPSWNEVASCSPAELAELIKPAGLGDTKSRRILAMLNKIKDDHGSYSLKGMFGQDARSVREYLMALDGVGPKTVACVMVFDLGLSAFPVDTHIARLSRRLGWVPETSTPAAIQEHLEEIVPDELRMAGHLNMIEHGRQICGARSPRCDECAITALCRSFPL